MLDESIMSNDSGDDVGSKACQAPNTGEKTKSFDGHVFDDQGETVTPNSLISLLTSLPVRAKPKILIFDQGNQKNKLNDVADLSSSARPVSSVEATVLEQLDKERNNFSERSESGTTEEFKQEYQEHSATLADQNGEISSGEGHLSLYESETFWIMDIDSRCVFGESPESVRVETVSDEYSSLLKARVGSELYVDDGMQTVHNIVKTKEAQTASCVHMARLCQVNAWRIFHAELSMKLDAREQLDSTCDGWRKGTQHTKSSSSQASFENLAVATSYIEKAILQNVYHEKVLMYRNYQTRKKYVSQGLERSIVHLWDFKCLLTEGRNVSCIAWNRKESDLIAVGYGELDFVKQQKGQVAFWSLKNPEQPELSFATPFGVTAVDFSSTDHNLLAVGLYDGTVSVYDVREPVRKPLFTSGNGVPGKHRDPVWSVQWVKRGADRDEALVSISSDGRITQWNLKKGLEHIDLMNLACASRKTTIAPDCRGTGAEHTYAAISRKGSGTCFDFSSRDKTVYIAGTEDGTLHMCSSAYSEQYLETFCGHKGPIHQVRWSPFASGVFLTASADRTIKLWNENKREPALTFQSGSEQVSDICWSPNKSTVFASTSWDGQLNVWDLSVSTLKPVLSTSTTSEKLNCISFSKTSPVIIAGGKGGIAGVYRLVGVDSSDGDSDHRLRQAMADAVTSSTVL